MLGGERWMGVLLTVLIIGDWLMVMVIRSCCCFDTLALPIALDNEKTS